MDLLTFGRIGVDIYPLQHGVGLADVQTFGKFLGGTATNVAVAAARHGRSSAVISGVGDDPFGGYLHNELRRLGVDDAYLIDIAGGPPTPVTFCEVFPPDNFPLYFYRYPTAPDLMITAEELPLQAIAEAKVFWATVTGLSQEPSRDAHFVAWQHRGPVSDRRFTVLDLDWRPMFWPDPAEASRIIRKALPLVSVAVGNREECAIAVGEDEPHRAADALLDRGVRLAVVKQGPAGVLAATADERVEVPPLPTQVVNGLGAGDGFGGALVHGLLAGWPLSQTIAFANAAGAIVASRLECSTAMPSTAEVDAAIDRKRA